MDINFSHAPFLASERNLVLETAGLDATTNASILTTENGRKYVKAGTVYIGTKVKGLVYEDIDLTDSTATDQVLAPIMTAGYFINDASVLPAVLTASTPAGFTLADAQKQGLFERKAATVTRP